MEHFPHISANSEIFVLTGAGISKESGLDTFRDNDGLWNNHRVEDVATPEAFTRNPSLVYDFYNNRRRDLNNGTKPNKAHIDLVELEKTLKINIITQNIDNLHEVAGNSSIIYMHGELNKVRCIKNDTHIHYWTNDLDEKLINVLTVVPKCALISVGLGKCPSKWMKFTKKRSGLPSSSPLEPRVKCIQLQALFPCLRK